MVKDLSLETIKTCVGMELVSRSSPHVQPRFQLNGDIVDLPHGAIVRIGGQLAGEELFGGPSFWLIHSLLPSHPFHLFCSSLPHKKACRR